MSAVIERPASPVRAHIASAVRSSEVFGALPAAVRRRITAQAATITLAGGDVLLREGDAAGAVYFVVTGRLRATRDGVTIGEITAGELFGEQALAGDRPRTATVVAVRDSVVLVLPPDAVLVALAAEPAALREVLSRVLDRSTAAHRPMAATTIALIPAGPDPGAVRRFARSLTDALARLGTVRVLSSRALPRDTAASGGLDTVAWLHAVEAGHDFVVYEADTSPTEWTRRCLRHADRVVAVAATPASPALSAVEVALLSVPAESRPSTHLVLVHPAETAVPSATASWLANRPVAAHHHVRAGRVGDVERVARSLAGVAVGLVLGGGGARGLAHLGVLRALEEADVPVDLIGGTSIGALMAASWAVGWDATTRDERVLRTLVDTRRLVGPTLPIVALSSTRTLTRLLQRDDRFGGIAVEDMWTPFFCVSANLSRAETVIHDRGPLWRALRASMSLPGIMPPVWHDGDLLVDGGVVDNLPVGVMRSRGAGKVVAVDVSPRVDLHVDEPFDPVLSGWGVARHLLRPRQPRSRVPHAVAVLMRAKEVGGLQAQRDALTARPPDLLLEPPVTGVDALDFRGAEPLVAAAHAYTRAHLGAYPPVRQGGRR